MLENLSSFLTNQHSRNKLFNSEIKHAQVKNQEVKDQQVNPNRIQQDLEKIYTDAFLPKWSGTDLIKLNQQMKDEDNIEKNKQWLSEQSSGEFIFKNPVTVFGDSVKDTTDIHARNLVEKQLNDTKDAVKAQTETIPYAYFWTESDKSYEPYAKKIWNKFSAYERCQTMAKRLNSANEYNDCSFTCESRKKTSFEIDYNLNHDGVATMMFCQRVNK